MYIGLLFILLVAMIYKATTKRRVKIKTIRVDSEYRRWVRFAHTYCADADLDPITNVVSASAYNWRCPANVFAKRFFTPLEGWEEWPTHIDDVYNRVWINAERYIIITAINSTLTVCFAPSQEQFSDVLTRARRMLAPHYSHTIFEYDDAGAIVEHHVNAARRQPWEVK
jgi:hypothetical protein